MGLDDTSRRSGGLRGRTICAGLAVLWLAGCAGGPGEFTAIPDVTNAPAQGFEKIEPGNEQDFILHVGRRTYFSENSAELDDTSMRTLDAQADWLRTHGKWYVKLQGHADDGGDEAKNTELSTRRAQAAMAYLASRGIPNARLWAKGYGRERPVRQCEDIECKAQNRRVVSNLRLEKDESAPD